MAALEAIVEQLEQGKLSLDEALEQFERGVQLSRTCQAALAVAEQRVEILLHRSQFSDELAVAPFEPDQAQTSVTQNSQAHSSQANDRAD